MCLPPLPLTLVFTIIVFLPNPASALGYGTHVRPIKRLTQLSTHSFDILPRPNYKHGMNTALTTLRHDDSFRLTLSAFNQTFHLHLRPNDELIHPAARIIYYTTSSEGAAKKYTVPLLRETVMAYWGEVVAAHHSPTRMREDAARVVHRPHPADLGFARIMIYNGGNNSNALPEYEGAFSANGDIYHIMTRQDFLKRRRSLDPYPHEHDFDTGSNLVIWRDSDVMTLAEFALHEARSPDGQSIHDSRTCGHDRLTYNSFIENPLLRSSHSATAQANPLWGIFNYRTLRARDDVAPGSNAEGTNFVNQIGNPTGCPTTQKVVYMGVAADCEYVKNHGTQDSARRAILNSWNIASALYKSTFNVSLGVVELQVPPPSCPPKLDPSLPWNVPCPSASLDDRLSTFSQWRGKKGSDGAGLWHLMSGCPSGSEVGIAWLATLCRVNAVVSKSNQFVSGTAVSTSGRTEWQVVAHEIGHNFGAIHDCSIGCNITDSCCPLSTSTCDAAARFIMSPISQSTEKIFSPCTLGNICSLMGQAAKLNVSCLVDPDPNRQIVSLQMCGNGIVEPGEDCDPGSNVASNCCDSNTCKFKVGALCDPDNSPCCTSQCSFAPSTQVCRPSKDTKCDITEICTGNSSSCPADKFAPNGKSCGAGLACASGFCTSPSLQCQSIGSSMGLNTSCPNRGDTSCQVSCQDPTKLDTCVLLGTTLVDGSPCGYGGTCNSGKCQRGSVLDIVKAQYSQNPQIAIPITIVVGITILLLLWALVRAVLRCCRGNTNIARGLHNHENSASYGAGYPRPPRRKARIGASLYPHSCRRQSGSNVRQ